MDDTVLKDEAREPTGRQVTREGKAGEHRRLDGHERIADLQDFESIVASASTPPTAPSALMGTASSKAMMVNHRVERVRLQATHETATACTKKQSEETTDPTEHRRKFASLKASPRPPSKLVETLNGAVKRGPCAMLRSIRSDPRSNQVFDG